LSVTVDTSDIVSVENKVVSVNDESERLVLEVEDDSVFDPIFDGVGECEETVEVEDRVFQGDGKGSSDGASR